jgi:LPS sulfotransferase NodH
VRRADKVGQAVSLWRAVQTRAWSSQDDPGERTPVYDHRGIAHLLARLEAHDAAWITWFGANDLAPLTVTYERFDAAYDATMHQVLDHLGLAADTIPPPPIQRQADERSARWAARFRAGDHTEATP